MQIPHNYRKEHLREREVTQEYPFTVPYLRKRRRLGLAPAFSKIGRMIVYSRSDLDAFLAAHRVDPQPEAYPSQVHPEKSRMTMTQSLKRAPPR